MIFQFVMKYHEVVVQIGTVRTRGGVMKMRHCAYRFYVLFFGIQSMIFALDDIKKDQWTWLFYKTIAKEEAQQYKEKNEVYFAKEEVPLFTQLIFSWNAFRPSKGYFSFWVCARESESKKWGAWHHMMDWGSEVQKSYKNDSPGFTRYDFVRLETKDSYADSFRIRAIAHDGAKLANLKAFSVSISNFNQFKPETVDNHLLALPSAHIEKVPMISQFQLEHQKTESICSPTSCTMLTSYFLQQKVDAVDFAEWSYDNGLGVYGSWPFNMAHAFERCEGLLSFFTARLNSFVRLHQRLVQGVPVPVSVRGYLPGQATPYRFGHLLVVVGYDAKKKEVVVHDPAFKTDKATLHRYPLKGFLEAWERSKRLAYLAETLES